MRRCYLHHPWNVGTVMAVGNWTELSTVFSLIAFAAAQRPTHSRCTVAHTFICMTRPLPPPHRGSNLLQLTAKPKVTNFTNGHGITWRRTICKYSKLQLVCWLWIGYESPLVSGCNKQLQLQNWFGGFCCLSIERECNWNRQITAEPNISQILIIFDCLSMGSPCVYSVSAISAGPPWNNWKSSSHNSFCNMTWPKSHVHCRHGSAANSMHSPEWLRRMKILCVHWPSIPNHLFHSLRRHIPFTVANRSQNFRMNQNNGQSAQGLLLHAQHPLIRTIAETIFYSSRPRHIHIPFSIHCSFPCHCLLVFSIMYIFFNCF